MGDNSAANPNDPKPVAEAKPSAAGDARPESGDSDAKLGDAKLGDAKPGDAKLGDAKPGDSRTGDLATDDSPGAQQSKAKAPTSLWRCLVGSAIAAALGYASYNLTFKIASQFATHPLVSDNYIAIRLSGMVRTLVLGIASMATGIFALAALGLAVLGLQTLLQKFSSGSSANS